jgi:release factor glutamine methyltransferase
MGDSPAGDATREEPLVPFDAFEFARTIRRGTKDFFGLEFQVSRHTLIPRAVTETLVATCLEFARERGPLPLTIADVGTGAGVIAVSLAVHLPEARVYALEASAEALEVARSNAQSHGVDDRITFLQGDLLSPLPAPVDLIAANPPYIRSDVLPNLPRAVRAYEPMLALDGGPDGLGLIRRIIAAAPGRLNPYGAFFMEINLGQSDAVRTLCRVAFPKAMLELRKDVGGEERVVGVWT